MGFIPSVGCCSNSAITAMGFCTTIPLFNLAEHLHHCSLLLLNPLHALALRKKALFNHAISFNRSCYNCALPSVARAAYFWKRWPFILWGSPAFIAEQKVLRLALRKFISLIIIHLSGFHCFRWSALAAAGGNLFYSPDSRNPHFLEGNNKTRAFKAAFHAFLPDCIPALNRKMHVPASGTHSFVISKARSINNACSGFNAVAKSALWMLARRMEHLPCSAHPGSNAAPQGEQTANPRGWAQRDQGIEKS